MKEETFYRNMLDNLHEGIYFVDVDRQITFWNKGAERITGFSASEVLNSHCYDNLLNHVSKDGVQLCFRGCPLQQTIFDGEERVAEVFLHHKEGYRVPVFIRAIPIEDEGKVIGAVEIFNDLSERLAIEQSMEKLRSLAMTDALTGIPNRLYSFRFIESKLEEMKKLGVDCAVVFFDIDNFKAVNDTYGHEVGDEMLKLVANTALKALRKTDMVGRWGGEEFVAVYVGIEDKDVGIVTEKLRFMVEHSKLRLEGVQPLSVTISIGATMCRELDTIQTVVDRADQLMYEAKKQGKNRSLSDLGKH